MTLTRPERRRGAPLRGRVVRLGVMAGMALVGVLAGIAVTVLRPTADPVARADAVVMLSGDQGNRLALSLRLISRVVAPVLVIDGEPDLPQAKELCRADPGFEVVCLDPQPDRTQTEARAASVLARQRGWRHLIVVTDPVHFARARLLFERCFAGQVSVMGNEPPPERTDIQQARRHEWLGLVQALFVSRGC